MPQTIPELLEQGAQANRKDSFRRGNLIVLPEKGTVVVTGDLHGHRRNFERIVAFADLAKNPDRHVVLQEIIHGGAEDLHGGCQSYKLLFDAVSYKLTYPDQVHIIMGNHDTACICDGEVMKGGKEMNRSMKHALAREFNNAAGDIETALKQYLFSQPLAVRCANRIMISHSLPDDRNVAKFDAEIFNRTLTMEDLVRPGSAYLLTWGRRHSRTLLEQMAELLDVDIFILGHQPQTQGWKKIADNLIILACDHSHGCLLPVDLGRSYTIDQLVADVVPLASIA